MFLSETWSDMVHVLYGLEDGCPLNFDKELDRLISLKIIGQRYSFLFEDVWFILIRDERTHNILCSVLFYVLPKNFFGVLVLFCSVKIRNFRVLFCSVFCFQFFRVSRVNDNQNPSMVTNTKNSYRGHGRNNY